MASELVDSRERFRVTPATAEEIERVVGPVLQHDTERNMALSPREQLLTALRFFATCGFYISVADSHGPSTATVHRTVHRVTEAIVGAFAGAVHWPAGQAEVAAIKRRFFNQAGIPDVVGCIDGTYLPLSVPKPVRHIYINRKGFPSLNCLAVAGPDREFFAVSLHCAGRVHDARVLATSGLSEYFNETGGPAPHSVLLGDSAYPLVPWLLTPVTAPASPAEEAYNRAHCRTRVTVENAFGVLKRRFPCLAMGMRMRRVEDSVMVFRACIALHNICIQGGDAGDWLGDAVPDEPDDAGLQQADGPGGGGQTAAQRRAGVERRNAVIRLFA